MATSKASLHRIVRPAFETVREWTEFLIRAGGKAEQRADGRSGIHLALDKDGASLLSLPCALM
jgi:hypothetical protein